MENQQQDDQRVGLCAGRKRRYRSWLVAPVPVPPPSTKDRMLRGQAGNEGLANVLMQHNPNEVIYLLRRAVHFSPSIYFF